MTKYIQILPHRQLLCVEEEQTVLQAALQSGYEFPYSCGSATCGSCMGKVHHGDFEYNCVEPYALDVSQREQGYALFCSAKPTTHMTIEVEDVFPESFIPPRKADYLVAEVKRQHGMLSLLLTPKKKAINFTAGQYIKIICPDKSTLSYSIANSPSDDGHIQLHIKEVDNPTLSSIINLINTNKPLSLRGPYGYMQLHPNLPQDILFIAGGSGVVPHFALLQQLYHQQPNRKATLLWAVNDEKGLFIDSQLQDLANTHTNFNYQPIVTNANAQWQGASGDVLDYLQQHFSNLANYQVYCNGPHEMVKASYHTCCKLKLIPQLFFTDSML